MSFRDKSALVTIIALVAASLGYVVSLVSEADGGPLSDVHYQPLMLGFVIVVAVFSIGGQILVAISSPREAQAPRDERERIIAWRSTSVSSAVLAIAAFVAITLSLAEIDWFWIANSVLALWGAAEILSGAVALTLSRRGV